MTLHWMREDTPHWDADKQRLFGPDELAAVGFHQPAPGAAIADEWWRVTDDDGIVVGRLLKVHPASKMAINMTIKDRH